jgi:hypothetical protein
VTDRSAGMPSDMDRLFVGADRSCLRDRLQPLVGNLIEPSFWRLISDFEKAPNTFFHMVLQLREELELHLGLDPTVGNCDFRLLVNENREQRLDDLFACGQCLMNVANHEMTGLYAKFDWSLLEQFINAAFDYRQTPDDDCRRSCLELFFNLHVEVTSHLACMSGADNRADFIATMVDPKVIKSLYARALEKLAAWASKKQQFDDGQTLFQSFLDHVNPSIEAIAMRLRIGGISETPELRQLERCRGDVAEDLQQFDVNAVSPDFILAPIEYDYDCRDPALGPEAIPMLIATLRAGTGCWRQFKSEISDNDPELPDVEPEGFSKRIVCSEATGTGISAEAGIQPELWSGFRPVSYWQRLLSEKNQAGKPDRAERTFRNDRKAWNQREAGPVSRPRSSKTKGDIQFLISFLEEEYKCRQPDDGWPK